MGQALPDSILTTADSILSSQFNGDGKLSSKTLPAVSQQVKGKAKIWTQNNPTTLLSLVGKNVCSTCGKTLPVWVPFPSAYGYGGRNECWRGRGGRGEKSVPETPREMVAVNTRLFLMIEGWEKGEICM